MKKLSDEQYGLIKTNFEKAQKNGDFKAKIIFAERRGLYYYAGKTSKLHGLFKRAYENFEKIGENKELEKLNKIFFPENFPKIKKTLKNKRLLKICEEKRDYGDWNKPFYNKINDSLTDHLNKIQNPKYSHQRIKILN